MPTVPGSRFIDKPMNISTSSRGPVFADPRAAAAPAAALGNVGQGAVSLAEDIQTAALKLGEFEDTVKAQDAVNAYHKKSREYTEGKRTLIGANAVGLSQVATTDLEGDFQQTIDALPTERSKRLFKEHAFNVKESFLNTIANHELGQIEKWRTDTVNAAYQNAAEDIKLSTGDPRIVADVISKYEGQLTEIYKGQDVTQMKQQHRALLEKAGREADNRYAETRAFDVVRGKFTDPATGEMDYRKAKNYLLDNPDKDPMIGKLTIQQREQLSNIIWTDGIRAKAQKEEAQADVAGKMWASYDKLLRGVPMSADEPQSFQEWHSRSEQYVTNGQMKDEVLKTAISYTKAEQLQKRQEVAAEKIQERQEVAAAKAARLQREHEIDRERTHSPLMMSDLTTLQRVKEKLTTDPTSMTIPEIIGLTGKGLSIQDAQWAAGVIKEAPGKAWSSPTGKTVSRVLLDYRRNYAFDNDDTQNNAGYSDAVTHFQKWMQKHPDADQEAADKEMRTFMYPYRRGWFKKAYDSLQGNAPILPKEVK